MALHLNDCPPALRAKLEAALEKQWPKSQLQFYAMATYLKGNWTIGPLTTEVDLVAKLVARYNLGSPMLAYQTQIGVPFAVTVQIE